MYKDVLDCPETVRFGVLEDIVAADVEEDIERYLNRQDIADLAELLDEGWLDPQE